MKKTVKRPNAGLDSALKEMAKLQIEIRNLNMLYDELKRKVFPLVEAAGGVYEVGGIKAQIVRSQIWQVDAIRLLKKFGEKVHVLMDVSESKFRKAFDVGMLGTQTELKGIAKLVEIQKFILSSHK